MGNTYTPVMHSTAATLEDLTPRQAKLYLILLASPQKTMLGVMTIRLRTLAAQVGTRTDSVSKDLRTLAEIGLITLCASATHLRVIADSSAGNRWNIDLINSESSALSLHDHADGHRCDAVAEALEILSTKGNKKPSKGEKKRATKRERHVTTRQDTSQDPPVSPKGKRTQFSKPTVDEVAAHMRAYAEGKGYALDADRCAEDFHGYWSDQGWRRRGGPMRSWQGTAQRKVRDAIDKGEYRIGGPVRRPKQPPLSRNAAIGQAWGELAMGKDYA
jgi:hypothetical protein